MGDERRRASRERAASRSLTVWGRNPTATLLQRHVNRRIADAQAERWREAAGLLAFVAGEGLPESPDAEDETPEAPADWRTWLRTVFPEATAAPLADRHVETYETLWNVEPGGIYPADIKIWPRGGGKSTTLEVGTVMLAARRSRRFVLYVRETQKQANATIANIGAKLQSSAVERFYPLLADRAVNRFGLSKGYTQDVLRTADGFVVMGLGLDAAARGLKIEDLRPDAIIFDDIDNREDTPQATAKKIRTLTDTILPLGTATTLIVGLQNLIHANSIFARLADGRADFLFDRRVSGPYPSLRGMKVRWEYVEKLRKRAPVIVAGEPTWAGQTVADCQALMWRFGPRSFLRENQHQVRTSERALWKEDEIDAARLPLDAKGNPVLPAFLYVVVALDPSGNKGKKGDPTRPLTDDGKAAGDACGIVVEGLTYDGRIVTLDDVTVEGRPDEWGRQAIVSALAWDADEIVGEANFGGEMVRSVVQLSARVMHAEGKLPTTNPPCAVTTVHASKGKDIRAEPVSMLVPEGLNAFAGAFPELEDELTTWEPGAGYSPNRLDAKVWASTRLLRFLRSRSKGQGENESVVIGTSA